MKSIKQSGYTLPELLIVISVSGVLLGIILIFAIGYTRFASSMQVVSDSFVSRLNISDYFREKLGASSGLVSQNSIDDVNTENPDTSISPAYYWKKLHAVPGTIANGSDGQITPVFYFKRYSQNTSGAIVYNGTNPYEDEYVIYLDNADKTLNVRTLANPNATDNKLKTSCPKALATNTCPADAKLIDQVVSVETRYFSKSGNLIDWTSIYDSVLGTYVGPDFPSVEVVEFKVNSTTDSKYQSSILNNATIIRVALRNS
jgi:prepilin-type N-terminal cleavage/methylation domain-containing protein